MIKPTGWRVLIRPDPIETKTESGIVLKIDVNKEEVAQEYGTIVALGPTCWEAYDDGEPWAKVGDRIVYTRYGGKILKDPETGEKFTVLEDRDVLAVLTKE